jgi:chemotaxis protein MotB
MMRFATRFRLRPEALVVTALTTAALATGCVTKGKHDAIVGALEDENGSLKTRVSDLERSNASLDAERVKLIDEMEDLRETRAQLTRDVEQLSKTKELLTEHLRKRDEEVQKLSATSSTYSGLVSELEAEVAAGQIQIEQLRDGIRLNLPQSILFPSGSAALDPKGEAVLRKVARKLREDGERIEVQGHTDNVKLSGALESRYGSNWELAAARAARVVRLFQSEKIDPGRLTAISYGEWNPVASNDDAEGRAKNRRIEIRLRPVKEPEVTADAEPGGGSAAAASASTQAPASEAGTAAQ